MGCLHAPVPGGYGPSLPPTPFKMETNAKTTEKGGGCPHGFPRRPAHHWSPPPGDWIGAPGEQAWVRDVERTAGGHGPRGPRSPPRSRGPGHF